MPTVDIVNDALTSGGQDAVLVPGRKGSIVMTSGRTEDGSDLGQEMSSPGQYANGHVIPSEEELATLRRVAGSLPATTYLLCAVEFAERASYYGCNVSAKIHHTMLWDPY